MNYEKKTMEDLGRMDAPSFKAAEKMPIVLVLDNLRSAHNIGSIFRTADAFRIEAIYLTGISAVPPQKEIMKTALGATESIHWEYFANTELAIDSLLKQGYRIVSIEQSNNSVMLQNFMPEKKTAFIFGNEVSGVSDSILALSNACVEIPQFGTKHSFNVSITAGIILWDSFLKIKTP